MSDIVNANHNHSVNECLYFNDIEWKNIGWFPTDKQDKPRINTHTEKKKTWIMRFVNQQCFNAEYPKTYSSELSIQSN